MLLVGNVCVFHKCRFSMFKGRDLVSFPFIVSWLPLFHY